MEVACMLLFISAIHKNVIKVHHDKRAYDYPKHVIHKSYEGAR